MIDGLVPGEEEQRPDDVAVGDGQAEQRTVALSLEVGLQARVRSAREVLLNVVDEHGFARVDQSAQVGDLLQPPRADRRRAGDARHDVDLVPLDAPERGRLAAEHLGGDAAGRVGDLARRLADVQLLREGEEPLEGVSHLQ